MPGAFVMNMRRALLTVLLLAAAVPAAASAGPLVGMLLTGAYRIPHLGWESTAIYTNTCGSASYRGPWMMETTARVQKDFSALLVEILGRL